MFQCMMGECYVNIAGKGLVSYKIGFTEGLPAGRGKKPILHDALTKAKIC